MTALEDPRQTVTELVARIRAQLASRVQGLYLFGSLVAGDFYAGRSDLDLWVVLDSGIGEGAELDSLRALHEDFENERTAWRGRVEAIYLSREVLMTFDSEPTGWVARISPGEPLHLRELGGKMGWLVDWYHVINSGETLFGPHPSTLGPPVTEERFRSAIRSDLSEWRELVRETNVAYVPAHQGYIVASVARGLYTLATGAETSKEKAVAWLADRRPDLAEFLWSSYRAYRADVRERHGQLIRFVDEAWDSVEG